MNKELYIQQSTPAQMYELLARRSVNPEDLAAEAEYILKEVQSGALSNSREAASYANWLLLCAIAFEVDSSRSGFFALVTESSH